jgi:hypothetical protein
MVAKLNAIVAQDALLGDDNVRLFQMNEARRQQGDRDAGRSRFAQAMGRQEKFTRTDGLRSRFMQALGPQERGRIAYLPFDGGGRRAAPRNDDPVHPEWTMEQQREWESGRLRPQFQGEREWEEGPERGRSGSKGSRFR